MFQNANYYLKMLTKGCLWFEEESFLWNLFQKGNILPLSFQF